MEVIYLLIPIALILTLIAVAAFWWAVGNGQYDDLEKHAHDILFDDEDKPNTKK
jgi:cbb3-type cytochrome oxidase maturation protein